MQNSKEQSFTMDTRSFIVTVCQLTFYGVQQHSVWILQLKQRKHTE